MTWTRPDGYTLSDDPADVDLPAVHAFLTASYWSPGIAPENVARAVAGSLPFTLRAPDGQPVGFARVVTDRTSFGYLADVYVLDAHRGRGLGGWLVATVLAHPDLAGLRRWMLATLDAHGLYAKHGFAPLAAPERIMEFRPPQNQYPGARA